MERIHEATRPDDHGQNDLWLRRLVPHTRVFQNIILILLFNVNIDLKLILKFDKKIYMQKAMTKNQI